MHQKTKLQLFELHFKRFINSVLIAMGDQI